MFVGRSYGEVIFWVTALLEEITGTWLLLVSSELKGSTIIGDIPASFLVFYAEVWLIYSCTGSSIFCGVLSSLLSSILVTGIFYMLIWSILRTTLLRSVLIALSILASSESRFLSLTMCLFGKA